MVENLLTKALREKVEEAVKDYRLPVKNGVPRAPNVLNGELPPKRSNVNDDFPFVVVRAVSGSVNENSTEFTIDIIIGCYTEEYDGHEYCLNVASRIRNALTTMKDARLEDKYILQFPINWDNLPAHPYPQWQITMTTKWIYRTTVNDFEC